MPNDSSPRCESTQASIWYQRHQIWQFNYTIRQRPANRGLNQYIQSVSAKESIAINLLPSDTHRPANCMVRLDLPYSDPIHQEAWWSIKVLSMFNDKARQLRLNYAFHTLFPSCMLAYQGHAIKDAPSSEPRLWKLSQFFRAASFLQTHKASPKKNCLLLWTVLFVNTPSLANSSGDGQQSSSKKMRCSHLKHLKHRPGSSWAPFS